MCILKQMVTKECHLHCSLLNHDLQFDKKKKKNIFDDLKKCSFQEISHVYKTDIAL